MHISQKRELIVFAAASAFFAPWMFVLNCLVHILNTGNINLENFMVSLATSAISGVLCALIALHGYLRRRG